MWGVARPKMGTGLNELPNRLSLLLAKTTFPRTKRPYNMACLGRIFHLARHSRYLSLSSCPQFLDDSQAYHTSFQGSRRTSSCSRGPDRLCFHNSSESRTLGAACAPYCSVNAACSPIMIFLSVSGFDLFANVLPKRHLKPSSESVKPIEGQIKLPIKVENYRLNSAKFENTTTWSQKKKRNSNFAASIQQAHN